MVAYLQVVPPKGKPMPVEEPLLEPTAAEIMHFPYKAKPERLTWAAGEAPSAKTIHFTPATAHPPKVMGVKCESGVFSTSWKVTADGGLRLTLQPNSTKAPEKAIVLIITNDKDPKAPRTRIVAEVLGAGSKSAPAATQPEK
jgi:hypothetical protein